MKTLHPYYLIFIFILLVCTASKGFGQRKLVTFNDDSKAKIYRFVKNDTIVVELDTAILLNKLTYHIYDTYYEYGRKNSTTQFQLYNEYKTISNTKDSLLAIKETAYQDLKAKFDAVVNVSSSSANKLSSDLTVITKKLTDSENSLAIAQQALTDAQQKLKDESRRQNGKALKFGIGGVLIGAIITAIIIH